MKKTYIGAYTSGDEFIIYAEDFHSAMLEALESAREHTENVRIEKLCELVVDSK